MSYFDYKRSQEISREPFYGIIMAAMRTSDSNNAEKLKVAFPDTWSELKKRYDAPGGCLSYEEFQRFHDDPSIPKETFEKMLKR
jgi:hypothetical protein